MTVSGLPRPLPECRSCRAPMPRGWGNEYAHELRTEAEIKAWTGTGSATGLFPTGPTVRGDGLMPFETPLALRWVSAGRYELTANLTYRGAEATFTVPAGYPTDLASVPRPVRWLIPQDGPWSGSAVLHDWTCKDGIRSGVITSRDADGLFRRTLREAGVPRLRRWLMWAGVRWSALTDPRRRADWWADAPAVIGLSLLAAPLVVPASLAVLAALAVYAVAEFVISIFDPSAEGWPV